jgi:hypothetical protein
MFEGGFYWETYDKSTCLLLLCLKVQKTLLHLLLKALQYANSGMGTWRNLFWRLLCCLYLFIHFLLIETPAPKTLKSQKNPRQTMN